MGEGGVTTELFYFDFVKFQFETEHFGEDAGQGAEDDDFSDGVQVRVGRQTGYLVRRLQFLRNKRNMIYN